MLKKLHDIKILQALLQIEKHMVLGDTAQATVWDWTQL